MYISIHINIYLNQFMYTYIHMYIYAYIFILQAPPNSHPFVLEGLVRTKTFFTLLLGVTYSVSKSESSSSSEVRNYDHHRRETNKQIMETNTPCVPFDVFLFYHWERYEKVDHVRHVGLREFLVANRFCPSIFCRSLSGTAGPLRRRKKLVGKTWKYSTNLHNPRSYTCPSFDVSLTPQKHAVL